MSRRRGPVETIEYIGMASRLIRRAGERCADGDEVELAAFLALGPVFETALQTAVDGMRERGMSWQYIASATGTSRQAAQQRWGH